MVRTVHHLQRNQAALGGNGAVGLELSDYVPIAADYQRWDAQVGQGSRGVSTEHREISARHHSGRVAGG